jgi:hypothetical protein
MDGKKPILDYFVPEKNKSRRQENLSDDENAWVILGSLMILAVLLLGSFGMIFMMMGLFL